MRCAFIYDNPYNKESIEIDVYFENDYSQESLDNFEVSLRRKLKNPGWLGIGHSFTEHYEQGYVKDLMQSYVRQIKSFMAME